MLKLFHCFPHILIKAMGPTAISDIVGKLSIIPEKCPNRGGWENVSSALHGNRVRHGRRIRGKTHDLIWKK